MDNLSLDAAAARAAGKSYGLWKADNPETAESNRAAAENKTEQEAAERQRQWDIAHQRTCPVCGAKFISKTFRVYCSEECRKKCNYNKRTPSNAEKKYTREKIVGPRFCQICGSRLMVPDPRVKYCSPECRKEASRIRNRERRDALKYGRAPENE